MKIRFFMRVIPLTLILGAAHAQSVDNYVPTKTERDARTISGINVPPVLVYSACASDDNKDKGLITCDEAPPATCTPQTVSIKGPSGETVSTKTICEKVNIVSNPNKLFLVTGDCQANSPSEKTATCTATNKTHAWSSPSTWWTNVSMSVLPMLDSKTKETWASQFCAGCTWEWVPSTNSCAGSTVDANGLNVTHNFSGNPAGQCTSVGVLRVSDPETGKTWDSPSISARLVPTPPVRNHTLSFTSTPGAGSTLVNPTTVETQGNTASITVSALLNGASVGSWPLSPIYCPQCTYSHTITSNSCQSVVLSGASTIASHPVSFTSSCSFSLTMRVTDPETLWTRTLGPLTVSLRKQPRTCFDTSETRWSTSTSSCGPDYTGSISHEYEEVRQYSCAGPYGPGNWSLYSATGATRNHSNTCVANCTVQPAKTQWVAASAQCPSGYTGSNTWQKEQRDTHSCPSDQWSGWADTGNTRNVSNTCAPPPPAQCNPATAPNQTQWIAASAACPSGQTGSHTWEKEQSKVYNGTYPVCAYGAWADTGSTRSNNNTCQLASANCPAYSVTINVAGSNPALKHVFNIPATPHKSGFYFNRSNNPDNGRCRGVSYQAYYSTACIDGEWTQPNYSVSCNY